MYSYERRLAWLVKRHVLGQYQNTTIHSEDASRQVLNCFCYLHMDIYVHRRLKIIKVFFYVGSKIASS
jgi:hypothetical protein